jgi:hypothetical protein
VRQYQVPRCVITGGLEGGRWEAGRDVRKVVESTTPRYRPVGEVNSPIIVSTGVATEVGDLHNSLGPVSNDLPPPRAE